MKLVGNPDFVYFLLFFLECMNLESGDQENREVAQRLGVSPADIDRYKTMFMWHLPGHSWVKEYRP